MSGAFELTPSTTPIQAGHSCEAVLFIRILNTENAVWVLLESGLYSELVLILKWSQGEASVEHHSGL